MSTRISSSGIHAAALSQMMQQQTALAKTQAQVASGKRFQTPAEDPIAAMRALDLDRSRSQLEQYGKNSDILQARLSVGEQGFADATTTLQRVRELALQANSGTLDDASLKSIATELRMRSQQLQDIANRKDTNGEYLFSGLSTGTQPFARGATGVAYLGDQGTRSLQIGASQKIADGIDGYSAFVGVPQANGTFAVASGVHTGVGSIDTGQVVDPTQWVPDNYTITFGVGGNWTVTDRAGAQVATGTNVTGGVIAFKGVQVTVSGDPATGDTFTVSPAGSKSLFDSVDELAAALTAGAADPVKRSQLNTNINRALTQLDQGLESVESHRSAIGARLTAINTAADARSALDVQLQGSISSLRDLDYAGAISRMNQQLVGLQAAQSAYSKIAQLSLFHYL